MLDAAQVREKEPLFLPDSHTQPVSSSPRDDPVLSSLTPTVGSFITRESAYTVEDLKAA